MKKTINVAIGGCSFIMEDDAYKALEEYLDRYQRAVPAGNGAPGEMDKVEGQIADILKVKIGSRETVSLQMIQETVEELGLPQNPGQTQKNAGGGSPVKRLFRDSDDKKIAGVCSGLALYLGVDVVPIRILFLIALFFGTAGFWIYLAVWIVAPEARNAEEKCELRGLPKTEENLRRFSGNV